jgi:lysophospholipase L1-like esterase
MTKLSFSAPLVAVIGLFSLPNAIAQNAAKNLAISPALHPGTEKKHESFNEISKQGEAPLVFLGDSITAGWNGRGKEAWTKTWAPLGAANFGIGGDRTEHILWRLQHGNYDGLKPKLTVLMIGTNNTGHQGRAMKEHDGAVYTSSAEQTAEGVAAIVKLLREKQPQMKILLLAIFPRGATNDDPKRRQNETTNQLISKLADGKTVFYLDINKEFLAADGTLSKDIMPDLLHPIAAGYQIWTDGIEGKVKELMDAKE